MEDAQHAHQMVQVARAGSAMHTGTQPATGENGCIRKDGKRDGDEGITLKIGHGRAGSQAAQESRRGGVLTASVDSAVTHKKMVHVEPGFMLQRFEWCGKQIEVANVYCMYRQQEGRGLISSPGYSGSTSQ